MSCNKLFSRLPAGWHRNMWREGFVSGNGRSGINVLGAIRNETVILNRGDLWYGLVRSDLPDVSDVLARMRKVREENEDYVTANKMLTEAIAKSGYRAACSVPLPLGELKMERISGGQYTDYRRILDMDSGEITVEWKQNGILYGRHYFVSDEKDTVVVQITSGAEDGYFISLGARNERDSEFPCPEDIKESIRISYGEDWISYSGRNDDGKIFGVVLWLTADGTVEKGEGGLFVTKAKNIKILLKLFSEFKQKDDREVLEELKGMADYAVLLKEQKKRFKKRYGGTNVSFYQGRMHSNEELIYECRKNKLSAELIEKIYKFGRYLFVSGTSCDGLPFALYGLWHGDYRAQWSQNVLNENLELIYSHVFTGNLRELLLPVFDYFDGMMDEYHEAARKIFGCRGIMIHGYSCPGMGGIAVNVPVITNWTGAAAWIGSFYYHYAKSCGDTKFIKERAIPFLREVCLFYRDFLYRDKSGKIEIYPSVSPENSPGNFVSERFETLSHPMPTAVNATMDIALIKQVIGEYLDLAANGKEDGTFCCELKEIVADLPQYMEEDGVLKEWCYSGFQENYNHRHFSHLYPLWPGDEINSDDRCYKFCAKAVEKRTEKGLHHQSGWSLTHLAAIYCRLHEGDRSLECLKYLICGDLLNNFFMVHNDWRGMGWSLFTEDLAPVQMDANMGYVNAIQEMLVHWNGKVLEILPALPAMLKCGKAEHLRFGCYDLSIEWNTEKGELEIVTDHPDIRAIQIVVPEIFRDFKILNNSEN